MNKTTTKIKVGDKVQVINKEIDNNIDQFAEDYADKIGTVTRVYTEEGYNDNEEEIEADMAEVDFGNGNNDYGQIEELKKLPANYRVPKMQFIVIWDEDEDPCEFFATLEKAKTKAIELAKDEDVSNIRIVEIKSLWTVEPEVKLIKKY